MHSRGFTITTCYDSGVSISCSGANVETTNNHGETPLHLAAKGYTDESIIQVLVEAIDVNTPDQYGRTALQYSTF
jgi:hypothetical protein